MTDERMALAELLQKSGDGGFVGGGSRQSRQRQPRSWRQSGRKELEGC
jgi:hypothetical protein